MATISSAKTKPILAKSSAPLEGAYMSKFVFGMGQSLDGYIAANGQTFSSNTAAPDGPPLLPPGPELHRYFNDHVCGLAGILYGRNMYEVMTDWDHEHSDWEEIEKDFAAAWRSKPKWVVSRSLKTVGANATLASGDLKTFARATQSRR
jgi:dihydrofolate reductase